MKHALKKYSSLLLLGIFLFAYTEKGIHDILHAGDVHCHTLSEKHFHNNEHHCFICDFDISTFGPDSLPVQPSFLCHPNGAVFPVTEANFNLQVLSSYSTRGPPALA